MRQAQDLTPQAIISADAGGLSFAANAAAITATEGKTPARHAPEHARHCAPLAVACAVRSRDRRDEGFLGAPR